jgi:hypothetical protein
MEQSRFSSFIGKHVTSGMKSTGSAYPSITASSTKDKFTLNPKAMALMGVGEGSFVVLIDVNKGEAKVTDSNSRWFITKGWERSKGFSEGAKIGKNGTFSYAGIYSAIMLNDPSITEGSAKDLVDNDKAIIRETEGGNQACIAKQKVTFKVEQLVEEDEEKNQETEFFVAEGVKQTVYCLTDMDIILHDPKNVSEEDDVTAAGETEVVE